MTLIFTPVGPVDCKPKETHPEPDCRTCSHYEYTRNDGDSCYASPCKDGHRYDPLQPLKLWRKT